METLYATVYYADDAALQDFGSRISRPGTFEKRDGRNPEVIKERLDRIVYRVRSLLDMYPQGLHFSIRVLSGYDELMDVYGALGATGNAPIAFYSHRRRTIYVSPERLTDAILAHEVSHAVINAYFDAPPPAQMQEILAQYVDKHLWDE
jgi:hypothetical protein